MKASDDYREVAENKEENTEKFLDLIAEDQDNIRKLIEYPESANPDVSLQDRNKLEAFLEENEVETEVAQNLARTIYEAEETFDHAPEGEKKSDKDHLAGVMLGSLTGDDELKRESGEEWLKSYDQLRAEQIGLAADFNLSEVFEASNDSAELDPLAGLAHRKFAESMEIGTEQSAYDALKIADAVDLKERIGRDAKYEAVTEFATRVLEEDRDKEATEVIERVADEADFNPEEVYSDPDVSEAARSSIEQHLEPSDKRPWIKAAVSEAEAFGLEDEYQEDLAEAAFRDYMERIDEGGYKQAVSSVLQAKEALEESGYSPEEMIEGAVKSVTLAKSNTLNGEESMEDHAFDIGRYAADAGVEREYIEEIKVEPTVDDEEIVSALESGYRAGA